VAHPTTNNLTSLFSGSCFWWYEGGVLSNSFSGLFLKKPCSKQWAALVPTLTHLDHRISCFWIQGSIVSSERCWSGWSLLFLHTKRTPRKAHFSFVLFSLCCYDCIQMIFPKPAFPAVQAVVLALFSLGLRVVCRKSIGRSY